MCECADALPAAGGFGPRGPPGPFPPFERNGFMDRGPPMMDMGAPMMMDMGAALQPSPLCTAQSFFESGGLHLTLIMPGNKMGESVCMRLSTDVLTGAAGGRMDGFGGGRGPPPFRDEGPDGPMGRERGPPHMPLPGSRHFTLTLPLRLYLTSAPPPHKACVRSTRTCA